MSNRAKSAGILAGFVFFAADIDFPRLPGGLVTLKEAEPRGQRAAGIFAHAPREGAERGAKRRKQPKRPKNETKQKGRKSYSSRAPTLRLPALISAL